MKLLIVNWNSLESIYPAHRVSLHSVVGTKDIDTKQWIRIEGDPERIPIKTRKEYTELFNFLSSNTINIHRHVI